MAVEVRNLEKTFRMRRRGRGVRGYFSPGTQELRAVRNLSLNIDDGELLAFIGPNGAGKSTTIKLITGILYPDRGDISVLGMDPHRQRRDLAGRIGTVFGQKSQLWYHLPPLDSLRLLGAIYGMKRQVVDDRIEELSQVLDIGEFLQQPVRKLSLGQRIRCEIAGSLIHSPEILFLDEPSIGLDLVAKQRLRQFIRKINREQNVTIFLTSHDVGDIEKICRRVVIINEGTLVWDGKTTDLKYKLMDKRVMSLKCGEDVDIDLPGVQVLKRRNGALKLEVQLGTIAVKDVLLYVMERTEVQDVGVSSIPMEEVIAEIYAGRMTQEGTCVP